jgi:hypothetical protein
MEMMAHKGGMTKKEFDASQTGLAQGTSWGLSPISRCAVDGFLKLPPLDQVKDFMKFVDWRQSGKISVNDLATVASALLPIDEAGATAFLQKQFKVGEDETVSEEELTKHVLPFLRAHCPIMLQEPEACWIKSSTSFAKAVQGLKMLTGVKHLYSLRSASKKSCMVADCFLVYELSLVLQTTAKGSVHSATTKCHAIGEAVAALAPAGSRVACSFFSVLLELEDDELSGMIVQSLAKISPGEPWQIFVELAAKYSSTQDLSWLRQCSTETSGSLSPEFRLMGRCIHTRMQLVAALVKWSSPGNSRVVQSLALMITHKDQRLCMAAMEGLASIAPKGDQVALAAITPKLSSGNKLVKRCAEETLTILAKGDCQTIQLFCDGIEHSISSEERGRSITFLGSIGIRGDLKIVHILSKFVSSKHHKVDDSHLEVLAIAALGNIAPIGHAVMKNIGDVLSRSIHSKKKDHKTADVAIRALGQLTSRNNAVAIELLNTVLDNKVACPLELRRLVLQLFAEIGQGGHRQIYIMATDHVDDAESVVRTEAIRTAGKTWHILEDHRTWRLEALTGNSYDAMVRREAGFAMEMIAVAKQKQPKPGCGCSIM